MKNKILFMCFLSFFSSGCFSMNQMEEIMEKIYEPDKIEDILGKDISEIRYRAVASDIAFVNKEITSSKKLKGAKQKVKEELFFDCFFYKKYKVLAYLIRLEMVGINIKNADKNRLLDCVCMQNEEETDVLKFLVQLGAQIDGMSTYNQHPLCCSLIKGHKNNAEFIVQTMILQGSSIKYTSDFEHNLLHFSCIFGNESVAEKLIVLGIDVNSTDSNNQTPLHLAVKYNNLEVVKTLVKHGANTRIPDNYGKIPVALAKSMEVWQFLVESEDSLLVA